MEIDYEPLEPNDAMKAKTASQQQSKELTWRVNRVNQLCKKYGANNCLYVSIHVNAAGNGGQWMTAGGWSCYTTKGTTISDNLAECLYKAADGNLVSYAEQMERGKKLGIYSKAQKPFREDKTDGDRDMEANFAVIKGANCAAVLTENMFQDNRWDVEYLQSDYGRHAIERIHIEGIIKYINRYMLKTISV